MNKKVYGLLLLAVLFFSVSATATPDKGIAAGNKNGVITLETDGLVVEIVGNTNLPSFFFWAPGNETDIYKLSFDQVFEAIDTNANGVYDLGNDSVVPNSYAALASLNWDFSEFVLTTDENNVTTALDFNITSSESTPHTTNIDIQFRIHMNIANANEMKFDVVINNYEFADADAMLVLSYKLITTQQDRIKANATDLEFGHAYFQSNSTADSGNSTLAVGLSHGDEAGDMKIYMAYEHFTDSFVHDPIIGISDVSNDATSISDPTDSTTDSTTDAGSTTDQNTGENKDIVSFIFPELSKEALFATSVLATLAFIAAPVAIRKMKK